MEYQMYYGNADLLLDESSNSKNSWEILSDSSMENERFFNWNGGGLKMDDGKANGRKRKTDDRNETDGNKMVKNDGQISIVERRKNDDGAEKIPSQNNSSLKLTSEWHEEIGNLNTDMVDSSLTTTLQNSYNLDNSILSISGLNPVFKQEAPSPTSHDGFLACKIQSPTSTQDIERDQVDDSSNEQQMINSTINQLLTQSGYTTLQSLDAVNLVASPSSSQDNFNVSSTNFNFSEDCRFQYVLAAATSIATKVNEDTLTYLNQGQSYEIKLKKLGDLSMYRGKMLKSVIRICFHERRLQYMEKEQMTSWQKARPGDRILDVDIPLSYGAFDIVQPPNALNLIHFNWDPTKEVGVYIMVNCISTEFTPKKHGGEKGVPFRIQVETYNNTEILEPSKRLHAAACQIKVFKLKGADRKHKQDRDKIMKRSLSEQEKYQPSYDCTVLNDIPNDAVLTSPPIAPILPRDTTIPPEINQVPNQLVSVPSKPLPAPPLPTLQIQNTLPAIKETSISDSVSSAHQHIHPNSEPEEITAWLIGNRFQKYIETFSNYSGSDMLRLSRNDLIQMCGQADGIRLFNALYSKIIRPKLKLYICRNQSNIYNAIYLSSFSAEELMHKLSAIVNVSSGQIQGLYLEGPNYIQIHLTDEVIGNLKDGGTFLLDIVTENNSYVFLLKPIGKQ